MASKFRVARTAGLVVGCVLVVTGMVVLYQWLHATRQGGEISSARTVTVSEDEPDETPVTEYQVAADMPRQISIPSISAKGFIQKVGTDQHKAIAVPGNVHMAGWYTESPKPGDKGNSILDGHVQGRYEDGVFKNLSRVKPDDQITVGFGDGTKRNFAVVRVDTMAVEQASAEQYSNVVGGETQLTLITCGGTYNRADKTYDKRVLVRARPMK